MIYMVPDFDNTWISSPTSAHLRTSSLQVALHPDMGTSARLRSSEPPAAGGRGDRQGGKPHRRLQRQGGGRALHGARRPRGQFHAEKMGYHDEMVLLCSQGAAEVVVWDPMTELVLAGDLLGFHPYVSSFAEIYRNVTHGSFCWTWRQRCGHQVSQRWMFT